MLETPLFILLRYERATGLNEEVSVLGQKGTKPISLHVQYHSHGV